MSEENFYQDELEKKLKQEAEEFSMQPSDMAWKKIQQQIHPQNNMRPFWWATAAVLLAGMLGGGYWLTNHYNQFKNKELFKTSAEKNKTNNILNTTPATSSISGNNQTKEGSLKRAGSNSVNQIKFSKSIASANHKQNQNLQYSQLLSSISQENAVLNRSVNTPLASLPVNELIRKQNPIDIAFTVDSFLFAKNVVLSALSNSSPHKPSSFKQVTSSSVANRKAVAVKKSHLRPSFDLIVIPSIGYRNLYQDNPSSYLNNPMTTTVIYASTARSYNISSQSLNQTPEAGFTIGVHVNIPMNDRFRFTTGLQVNKTGYKIEAVPTSSSGTPVPGSSQTSFGSGSSLGVYSNTYAVTDGSSHINNKYVTLEMPLMMDYGIPMRHNWSVHFSSGVGIDYLLYKQAYIYTSIYKRYFADNSLVRNWNADFLFTSYLSIPVRKFFLQIGPDFHYQLINSYTNDYPMNEYPYAAGFRIGISWKP